MPNLAKSLRSLQNKTNQILPGTLGLSTSLVNVPNRAGYSYVQLLGNTNELIQAYNAVVTPQYGLPVLVQWNGTRYVIIGRDVSRYTQWSYSAYLPLHGDTHQWNGGDTTWVHSEQLYPLSVSPSGTSLFIAPYSYNWKGVWVYGGMTGTSIITLPIDPTKQKIMLLYLDGPTGNPVWLAGTEAPLYTQAYQLLPYLPTFNLSLGIPLSMIAIPSGTTSWSWSNIYDLRQFIGGMSVPSGTWGGIPEAPQDGFTYGRKNAAWSPVSGSSGIGEAPIDGNVYGRKNAGWSVVSGSSGAAYSLPTGSNSILGGFRVGTGLSVYPDGTLNVTGSSSTGTSGVPEAPNDGNPYIRQSDGWKALMATAGSVSGGTESDDGTYHYHIFTSGGTLTVISSTVVDVLVVAGGGAGGTYNGGQGGGGGGAGGLCYQAHRTLTVGSKTVVVGNGGNAPAGNGQDSTFDGIDAVGGGGGGGVSGGANGKNGGSGGAGSGGGTGGSATQGNSSGATGYGNAGANAGGNGAEGGGGGGAGSAGAQAIGNAGGIGGTGNSYNISGAATTYAVGGTGGGNGEGAPGSAGGANTGNGGGSDAAGGSGIVIIRHPSSITVATTDVMFKSVYDTDNNGIIDSSALPITTSLGTPGVDTLIPTEKAVRSAIGAISGSSSGGSFSVTGTSVTNDFISFADSSGKTGIDSGYGPASFAPSGTYSAVADLTGTAETLGETVTVGVAVTAARSDHKHAITNPALDTLASPTDITTLNASTGAHGLIVKPVAPAANLMNVPGIVNGETVWSNKPVFDATNPAALGSVGPGTAVIAAHRDHIHAMPTLDGVGAPTDVTTLNVSTSAHGLVPKAVAPAANALNVFGIANGETAITNKTILTTTAPSTQAFGDSASAGTNLDAAHSDHKHAIPVARIELTATLTYYVRTDGNDSNNGLANTSGGAFLTIQHAINVASALDNGGYNITIQVADGTYVSATEIDMKSFVGSGLIIIQGNTTTPANCVLSFSGAGSTGFSASGVVGVYQIQGFRLKATNTGTFAISVINFSYINIQNLDFNTGWSTHISSQLQAAVNIIGNYTISGSANAHMDNEASIISCYATITVTISGTPAWGYYFTHCGAAGWTYIEHGTVTYSGASTGKRYVADTNGILGTDGGGSTYFPGNAAGTTATGGLYS